jgi:DNA-binding transcriptional LysR family regulator
MNNLHIDLRDLNLLAVLDAVLTEGSNRAAAAKLGVTQSAVSHALGRLRQRLGDPLVVPTGGRMVPTPLAESLAPALRESLERLGSALRGARGFDPERSTRTFWVSSADLAGMVVLPPLVRELTRAASGVSVRLRPPNDSTLADLERGGIDVALGIFGEVPAAFRVQALFRERFVCVARQGHPVTGGRLTLARYLEQGGGGRPALPPRALRRGLHGPAPDGAGARGATAGTRLRTGAAARAARGRGLHGEPAVARADATRCRAPVAEADDYRGSWRQRPRPALARGTG